MLTVSQKELRSVLGRLDHAIHNHQAWFEEITRTLICRLPYNERDVREDAYRKCQFGQWYYHEANQSLREHAGFKAIEEEHASMHGLASALLLYSRNDSGPIASAKYDQFAGSVHRLRLQILSLQRELQDSLLNLDPLTGARNRTGMLSRLREQHELAKREAQICCLAMMDLDHFKRINDEHGHPTGDLVLTEVAHYILGHIRPYDFVYRYGGEEFLVCMQQTDLAEASGLTERLRKGIEELDVRADGDVPVKITASFGLAPLDPGVYVEESVHRADQALYSAKQQGRNCIKVWENEPA